MRLRPTFTPPRAYSAPDRSGRDDLTMTHEGAPAASLEASAPAGRKAKQAGGTMLLANQLWLFDSTVWDEASAPESEKLERKRRRRAARAAVKPVQLSLFVPASA